MTERPPIETLVNALLVNTVEKSASHLRATPTPTGGSVQLWIDGGWEEELAPSPELYLMIVRRLGVMIGVLPPKKGEPWFGRVRLRVDDRSYYFLVAIDRGEELHALVERVDEAEILTRRQPRPPSPHPYRHG